MGDRQGKTACYIPCGTSPPINHSKSIILLSILLCAWAEFQAISTTPEGFLRFRPSIKSTLGVIGKRCQAYM